MSLPVIPSQQRPPLADDPVFRGAMTTPTNHCEIARLATVFRFKSLAAPPYQEEQAEEEQEEQEETG